LNQAKSNHVDWATAEALACSFFEEGGVLPQILDWAKADQVLMRHSELEVSQDY
jgi:hypothetical protein